MDKLHLARLFSPLRSLFRACHSASGKKDDKSSRSPVPKSLKAKLFAAFVLFLGAASLAFAGALYFSVKPVLLEKVPYGKIVLDRSGGLLKISLAADDKYRLPIRLEQLPKEAINALLKYEDQYFYEHPGINVFSMFRAVAGLFGLCRRTGASTVTMQTARLAGNFNSASVPGKLRQIWLALCLERHYSKNEILEAYFNLAPYGGNIEGIEAASRIYFNKSSAQLTPLEVQALTVIPQNPSKRNPLHGRDFNRARNVLPHLLNEAEDKMPPLAIRPPASIKAIAPHLARELLEKGKETTICSTIERDAQLMLERGLQRHVERLSRYGVRNAAAMIVNADDMSVIALAGSSSFFNDGISGQIDGTRAKRSPGSTLKPFIYALALEQGLIHPASILPDSPKSFGGYDPENFERDFRGPVNAAEALRASRNLPAIHLAEKLENPDLYAFLKKAGIDFPHGREYYGLALTLGGAEISMRDLAALYAMLVNRGLWRELKYIEGQAEKTAKRLLSPESAWLALHMLERPEAQIPNRGKKIPLRFKTGTSNGLRDAWTAAILGNYALVVWLGNFDNSSNPMLVGAKCALPLMRELAVGLSAIRNLEDRHGNLYAELNLAKAEVCAATGDFAKGQCRETVETIIIPGVSPVRDSGIIRPVLIDKASGLRACIPQEGKTETNYWEFWPSEFKNTFISAGIRKPEPPEWLPECKKRKYSASGPKPGIILPKKNVVYHSIFNGADFKIPLLASADSDAGYIHWYAGKQYIGKSRPGQTIFWKPNEIAAIEIFAMDDKGNTSSVKCGMSRLGHPREKSALPAPEIDSF